MNRYFGYDLKPTCHFFKEFTTDALKRPRTGLTEAQRTQGKEGKLKKFSRQGAEDAKDAKSAEQQQIARLPHSPS